MSFDGCRDTSIELGYIIFGFDGCRDSSIAIYIGRSNDVNFVFSCEGCACIGGSNGGNYEFTYPHSKQKTVSSLLIL